MKNEDIDNAIACLRAVIDNETEPEGYQEDYRRSLRVFELLRDRSVPAVGISYADRFAIPMLTTRKLLLEQHCLMAEAREVAEQIKAVTEWQVAHLGLLTPSPGVVPVNIGPTDDWR